MKRSFFDIIFLGFLFLFVSVFFILVFYSSNTTRRALIEEKADNLTNEAFLFEPTITGYVRGGVSPIGMKKHFPTYIEETAALFDSIYISAGKRGVQLIVSPEALMRFLSAQAADLIQE